MNWKAGFYSKLPYLNFTPFFFFAYFLFEKSQNHLFKQTQNCVNQNIRKLLTVLASANGTCTMDYKLHVWIYCNQQYNDVIECLVTKNRVKIKKKKVK